MQNSEAKSNVNERGKGNLKQIQRRGLAVAKEMWDSKYPEEERRAMMKRKRKGEELNEIEITMQRKNVGWVS